MKVCYFDAFCGIGGDMTGAGGYGRSGGPLLDLLCPFVAGRRTPDRMFS